MEQDPGEKVVTEAFTLLGTVFFVSFSPGIAGDACVAGFGKNRLYRVSITDGSPKPNPDELTDPLSDPLEPDDRFTQLMQGGIAPGPVFFFTNDGPELLIGVEDAEAGIENNYQRTFWFQDETQ